MSRYRNPPAGWEWRPNPSTSLGSSGPARVVVDQPAPAGFKPRPAGFVLPPAEPEPEPDRWEGDDS